MRILTVARLAATLALSMSAAMPAAALNLPFGLGGEAGERRSQRPETTEPPVRYAQAGDPVQRINQLEEDNRRLNGRVEELSFQLLQMQEQLRKFQEDNEFRFQELEGGSATEAGADGQRTDAAPAAPVAGDGAPSRTAGNAAEAPTGSSAAPGTASGAPAGSGDADEIGSLLVDGGLDTSTLGGDAAGDPSPPPPAAPGAGSSTIASITPNGPGELYDLAYNYILAGDYQLAEDSFRQYAQTYPDAEDVPDAEYWLGESLFQQAKYTDAAKTFLDAQKDHPQSPKAPEMMLKLGMSLAKLDNRETACVTFTEVSKRYPAMSDNVKKKLQSESAAANC